MTQRAGTTACARQQRRSETSETQRLFGLHPSGDQRVDVRLHLPATGSRQIRHSPVVVESQPPLSAQVVEVIAGDLLTRSRAGGGATAEAWQEPGSGAWGLRRRGRHSPA